MSIPQPERRAWQFLALAAALALAQLTATACRAQSPPAATRLPAPAAAGSAASATSAETLPDATGSAANPPKPAQPRTARPLIEPSPPEAGEFERLATEANGGRPLLRFGSQMQRSEGGLANLEVPARVPPRYAIQVGDELTVNIWGSVDAEWRLRVDRSGRVTLPRVGPVAVAGAAAGALEALLRARLERVFKGFDLSAAITEVSPLRVHVTGFVERPGDYIVPGLATISRAITLAQGPSAGGSFRRIRLIRDNAQVVVFDFYALLAAGNRSDDVLLRSDDVLHVEAAGPQAAIYGSVNRAGVFEFLPGETVADLLRLAGGLSSLADRTRLTLERLDNRSAAGAVELALSTAGSMALADGDQLRALSRAAAAVPTQGRNKRVRVGGEVLRPGEFLLGPDATLDDAISAAGGLTSAAFIFGTDLRRERVRLTQEVNYARALQELEAEVARDAAVRTTAGDDAAAKEAATRQLLARLRNSHPEGRIVLEVTSQSVALPAFALEDGDQILIPPRTQSVGVFGSVFNSGSFVHDSRRSLGYYLQRAGGPTHGADADSVFVVRANGSVVSARQHKGWGSPLSDFETQPALPGDTLFVPEELSRTTFVQGARDWTQILYQLGLGLAGLRTLR